MAAPRRAVAAPQFVNFLRPSDYSVGGFLPDGDYLISDMSVNMFQAMKNNNPVGPSRLAVRVTFEPPTGATSEDQKKTQQYSMGTNAHLTYQPDPATGKKLVMVPNGPAAPLYESSNWFIFLKSMYDAGLPDDYAIDDISTLEGCVVHITSIPESDERKEFRARTATTGEVAPTGPARENKIAVVMEFKSAPWMDGTQAPATAAAPAPAPAARAAAPVAAKATPAPAAAPPAATNGNGLRETASNAIANFLGANPNGAGKMVMRMAIFKSFKDDVSTRDGIMNTYFSDDNQLTGLLEECGYKLDGVNVVLA